MYHILLAAFKILSDQSLNFLHETYISNKIKFLALTGGSYSCFSPIEFLIFKFINSEI